jgi:hypothetical protein
LAFEIAAKVCDAIGGNGRIIVRLRENERALDHGLREERHALGVPVVSGHRHVARSPRHKDHSRRKLGQPRRK